MVNLKIYITLVLTLYLLSSNAKICFKTQVDNFDSGCEGPWSNTSCIIANGMTHCDKSCRRTQVDGLTKVKISCRGLRGYTDCNHKCKGDDGNGTCSGTKSYCDKYGCSLSNRCYCDLHVYDTKFQCDISGDWKDADIIYVMFSVKEYEFIMPQGNPTPWGVLSNRQRVHASRQARSSLPGTNLGGGRALVSGLTISFETPRVIVGTQNPEWTNVLVSKDGISEMSKCNTTRCEILLSSRFFINPGKVKVVVYLNDTFEAERSFNVGIQSRCDIPNCIFCAEMYYDFVCYPIMFKIFLISLLVASLLASIIMVGFIIKMILKYSLISCCIKSIKAANYKRKHKAKEGFNEFTENDFDSELDVTEDDENIIIPRHISKSNNNNRLIAVALILLVPMILAAPCSQGITITSDSSTCFYDKDIQICTVHLNSLLSISSPGLAACVTVIDSQGDVITYQIEPIFKNKF